MPSLDRKLNDMEAARRRLRTRLDGLSLDDLRREPAQGKWSILQIVDHLVDSEQKSLAMLRKNLAKENRPRVGLMSKVRMLGLRSFFALSIPVKAPPIVAQVTSSEELNLDGVWRSWDETRREWAEFLENFPADRRRDALFFHPVAKRLDVGQALEFQRCHARRHARQIASLIRSSEIAA